MVAASRALRRLAGATEEAVCWSIPKIDMITPRALRLFARVATFGAPRRFSKRLFDAKPETCQERNTPVNISVTFPSR
jgi:hypothetical protein